MSNGNPSAPLISVIIPVFNNAFYTRLCLQALRAGRAAEPPFEIVIVDNASSDDTPAILREFESEIAEVVRNDTNLGFAVACNQGARRASGHYLLFLNNDVVVEAGCLQFMLAAAEADATIGVVGARLLYPDGTIQHAGIRFGPGPVPYHAFAGYPGNWDAASGIQEYQAVTGACLLIEKARFHRVGGFDEDYLNSFEDIDLCLKVRREGRRIVYCSDAVGYHFESATPGRFFRDDRNSHRFRERWASIIQVDGDLQEARIAATLGPASLMRLESDAQRQRATALAAENAHLRHQLADQLPRALEVFRLEGCSQDYCENLDVIYRPSGIPMLVAKEHCAVPISLINCGRRSWAAGQLQLSYHWHRDGDADAAQWEGLRAVVDAPLSSGGVVAVMAALVAPDAPGDYILEWDALEEGIAWLSQRGVTPYRQHVPVLAAPNGVVEIEGLEITLNPGAVRQVAASFKRHDEGGDETSPLGWSWIPVDGNGKAHWCDFHELPRGSRADGALRSRVRFKVRAPELAGSFRLQIAERHTSGAWLAVETVGGKVQVQGDVAPRSSTGGDTKPIRRPRVEDSGNLSRGDRRRAMDDVAYFRARLRRYASLGRERGFKLEEELAGERQSRELLFGHLDRERSRGDRLEGQVVTERARGDRLEGELAGERARNEYLAGELAGERERGVGILRTWEEERARSGRLATELAVEQEKTRSTLRALEEEREKVRCTLRQVEDEREKVDRAFQQVEEERARTAMLAGELEATHQRIAELAGVVSGFQNGRLMRVMAAAHRIRSALWI